MNVDIKALTDVIAKWATILSLVIVSCFTIYNHFATRSLVESYDMKSIDRHIDAGEKLRDYYQTKLDDGEVLTPNEARRMRINNSVLDDLYEERADKKDLIEGLE